MLIDYFVRGGWVMWPILGVSVVALAIVLNRALFFLRVRNRSGEIEREVYRLLDAGRASEARSRAAASTSPVAQVLEAGLSAWSLPQEEVERRLEETSAAQLDRAESHLPLLGTSVAVLPMLGFLGTILGLIGAFGAWAAAGANVSIEALAGGIQEAMITTAAGLVTSIPYVVAYNVLASAVARFAKTLNAAASGLAGRHRVLSSVQPVEPLEDDDIDVPIVISLGGQR